jgi:hypothetical protein
VSASGCVSFIVLSASTGFTAPYYRGASGPRQGALPRFSLLDALLGALAIVR